MYKQLQPVTAASHGKLTFKPLQSFSFTRHADQVEVVAAELSPAALNFPLAFARVKGGVRLVGLLSLEPGHNVFVTRQGRWLAEYVPAGFSAYPFTLGPPAGARGARLHVDADSGMIIESGGHAFFGQDNKPSPQLKEIVRFLYAVEKSQHLTRRVCAIIAQHKLLVPWGQFAGSAVNPDVSSTLFRADEAALNSLPQGMLSFLQQAGALPLLYAHLISLGNLAKVTRLARHHAASAVKNRELLGQCLQLKPPNSDTFAF